MVISLVLFYTFLLNNSLLDEVIGKSIRGGSCFEQGGTLRMYQKWDACACQLCTWILNIAGNMSYDRLILFQCVDHVCVCVCLGMMLLYCTVLCVR